jgi:hypothetical protein
MANQRQSRKTRPSAQQHEEQKGFFGAIWSSIKDFFQNIVSKLKEVMEYATRLKNGKKDWENSIEGQAAPKNLTFKPSDQIAEEQIHFPGFHDMTMANGMVRIPVGTEDIWPIEDKQRYLNALHEKFESIPDPLENENGAFITDISQDIQRFVRKGHNGLTIYGVGNTIITTDVQGDKCKISISDGTNERSVVVSTPKQAQDALAALYAGVMGKENEYIMRDSETQSAYITRKNLQDNTYYTFTAAPLKRHVFNFEKQERFIIASSSIKSIIEVQGPTTLENNTLASVIPANIPPMSNADKHQMATAMHEFLVDNAPKQEGDSIDVQNNPNMYVTQDKMFWLTAEGNQFVVHVAPLACQYVGIKQANIKLSIEACQTTDEAHALIYKAINNGIRNIDKQIEERIEHPQPVDLPLLAIQALNGVEHGMPVVEVETKNHHIKFEGFNLVFPKGCTQPSVAIEMDGVLLYGDHVTRDEQGAITVENVGVCNDIKDALQKIRDTVRNQRMTRVEQEVEPEVEPEEVDNNLNQEEQVINDDDAR